MINKVLGKIISVRKFTKYLLVNFDIVNHVIPIRREVLGKNISVRKFTKCFWVNFDIVNHVISIRREAAPYSTSRQYQSVEPWQSEGGAVVIST